VGSRSYKKEIRVLDYIIEIEFPGQHSDYNIRVFRAEDRSEIPPEDCCFLDGTDTYLIVIDQDVAINLERIMAHFDRLIGMPPMPGSQLDLH
jgi:hypothetical protein